MEALISWSLGFFCGYLTIRAIRSFQTVAACLAFMLWTTTANAAYFTGIQVSGTNPSTTQGYYLVTDCYHVYVAPGATATTYCGSIIQGNTIYAYWCNQYPCQSYIKTDSYTPTANDQHFSSYGPGGTYANWGKDFALTNNLGSTAIYKLVTYDTNHVAVTTNTLVLNPGEIQNFSINATNYWTSALYGPPSQSSDFMADTLLGTQTPTNTGETGEPNPYNNQTTAQTDPFTNLPQYNPTTTNSAAADRQNAQGLLNAIGYGNTLLQNYLPKIAGNSTGGGGTNNTGTDNDLLKQIVTNTSPASISTNAGALSNAVQSFLNSARDEFVNGIEGTNIANITNSMPAHFTDGDIAAVKPLVSIPINYGIIGKYLSIDIEDTDNPLFERLQTLAPYVKRWFGYLIGFVIFWLIYSEMQDEIKALSAQSAVISAGGPKYTLSGSALLQPIRQALVWSLMTAILVSLPTFTWNFLNGNGFTAWFPGFANDLETTGIDGPSGPMTSSAIRFYKMLGYFVPWSTLWVGIGNYAWWIIGKDWWTNLASRLLRALGIAVAFAICTAAPDAQATEVHLENLTGSTLTISNQVEILSIPAGLHTLNLEPGNWTVGTNEWDIPTTENIVCLRFAGSTSTNGPPVYTSVNQAESASSQFWSGYFTAIAIFGLAWMVSALRQGVQTYKDL